MEGEASVLVLLYPHRSRAVTTGSFLQVDGAAVEIPQLTAALSHRHAVCCLTRAPAPGCSACLLEARCQPCSSSYEQNAPKAPSLLLQAVAVAKPAIIWIACHIQALPSTASGSRNDLSQPPYCCGRIYVSCHPLVSREQYFNISVFIHLFITSSCKNTFKSFPARSAHAIP